MAETDLVPETLLTPELAQPIAGALAPSPYSFRFTAADALRVTVHNSQAGAVVAIHFRIQDTRGNIQSNVITFTPTADRLPTSGEYVIGEGYLLNVTVFASSGAPRRGQTFIRAQVIHGRGVSATVLGTIVQGYVTANQDRAWPGSPIEGSLDGDGYTRTVNGTDPAAGVQIQETVPTGARWKIQTCSANITTSAAAGNRNPFLALSPSAGQSAALVYQPTTLAASASNNCYWSMGVPFEATHGPNLSVTGLPDVILLPGGKISIAAIGFLAGDNWDAPGFFLTEWLEAN